MDNKPKKYLFICLANMERSPTGKRVFEELSKEKGIEVKVESAGLMPDLGRQVTKEIADNADVIFVMEPYMKIKLINTYSQNPEKIISLNIPDIYKRHDPELVNWLKRKLEDYL